MKQALRFLIPYFIVYFAVALAVNLMLGPPAMSESYLGRYGSDHERYLTISKSAEYKLYRERPQQHPASPAQEAAFAFADEYQSREAYVGEMARRGRYGLVMDYFTVRRETPCAISRSPDRTGTRASGQVRSRSRCGRGAAGGGEGSIVAAGC
jgi:hypothetical protein